MSADVEQLRKAVEFLEFAYDQACKELAQGIAYSYRNEPENARPEPWQMKTNDGRYILLDALTTLVNARATLVKAGSGESL